MVAELLAQAAEGGGPHTAVWVAVVTAGFASLTGIVTAVIGFLTHRQAKEGKEQATQANDAVNHRHAGQPRIFDMVINVKDEMSELRTDQSSLADHLETATLHASDERGKIRKDVAGLEAAIHAHVEWEEGPEGKYSEFDNEIKEIREVIRQWEAE
ncbi:MAG: hypothetical protein HKN37_12920 [Rhodothermales bacterium]|nr:hypothetical protein [Rhodothermales bacterium]